MPRMYGKRVMLREYQTGDLSALREWVNEAQTTRYLSSNYWCAQSQTDSESFLNNMMQGSKFAYNFVIADARDERYLGQLDIFRVNWQLRQGEIGMVIGLPENRGKGYGTEALKLLQDFAFGTLGLERLELEVALPNESAHRCYQKVGFVDEGVRRHAFFCEGQFCDLAMMSMLKSEYEASRA